MSHALSTGKARREWRQLRGLQMRGGSYPTGWGVRRHSATWVCHTANEKSRSASHSFFTPRYLQSVCSFCVPGIFKMRSCDCLELIFFFPLLLFIPFEALWWVLHFCSVLWSASLWFRLSLVLSLTPTTSSFRWCWQCRMFSEGV